MSASSSISTEQRYTRARPCPVCNNWDSTRRGQGRRCYGFLSHDGLYAHCTREEYAGALPINPRTETYAHRLGASCKCGAAHLAPAWAPSPIGAPSASPRSERSNARPDRAPQEFASRKGETSSHETIVGRTPTATYAYRDASGALVHEVLRYPVIDTETGEHIGKTFKQRRPIGRNKWAWNLDGVSRVLYRLPELLGAPLDAPVFLCEGEKCADALARQELVSTCNVGGAGKWAEEYTDALRGRPVVILPDNDPYTPGKPHASYTGQKHAQALAEALYGHAASVRVLMLPELPSKGDVYDWLEAGHTRDELLTLAEACPVWTPDAPSIVPALPVPDRGEGDELAGADGASRNAPRSSRRSGRGTTDGAAPLPTGEYHHVDNTRWYLTPDWVQIVQAPEGRGRGKGAGEEDEAPSFVPVYAWGAPRVHARINFASDEAPQGRATLYDIEIDGQRERVSYGELHKGECWERWGTLGIAGRTAISAMAATVEYIARNAPRHRGARSTGWTLHDGRHVLALPHGELLGASGIVPGARVYLDIISKHTAPYMTGAPIGHELAAQGEALAFLAALSPIGAHAALVTCGHIRSLMYGVWRSDFSLLLRGTSGRGKTSLSSYGRNLTGDFAGWPAPPASASFTDTVASIEDALAQVKHLPATVDDLAIRDDMSAQEQAEKARILDMLVRSIGNNTPVRERMTRTMERQIPRKIEACPVFTAERLPGVLASALNRAVLLDMGDDDLNKDAMRREGERHAPALRGVGYGLVSYIAGKWDAQGDELARDWQAWHRETARRIEEDMCSMRDGRRVPDNAARLPSNGAHLLLAARVLADYCTHAGIACPITPDALYTPLLAHLCAQVETIGALDTGGNDGTPLGEWVADRIRAALATRDAYVLNTDGTLATDGAHYAPDNLGYRRTALGEYEPGRMLLGHITADGAYLALDTGNVHELLKRAARTDRRPWTVAPGVLARTLRGAGIVSVGEGHHIERRIRVQGRLTRRLCIPCDVIWPDWDADTGAGIAGAQEPQETPQEDETRSPDRGQELAAQERQETRPGARGQALADVAPAQERDALADVGEGIEGDALAPEERELETW